MGRFAGLFAIGGDFPGQADVADISEIADDVSMKALLLLALLASTPAPADHPHTYLLSIGDIPLQDAESINGFSIETWGVEFKMVCRIPSGWRIKAGSSATPNGEFVGEGSQGATWFNQSSPSELRSIALVTLYAPVQRTDVRSPDGISSVISATFKGYATISTDDGEAQRPITSHNITLTPAGNCPTAL